jgi:hypothetical protein
VTVTSGNAIMLSAGQYTDGRQPEMQVIYDNVELRTSEISVVGFERAVRLTWPAGGSLNYCVEGAANLEGPWLPIPDWTNTAMNQITVPATGAAGFLRLRQAP